MDQEQMSGVERDILEKENEPREWDEVEERQNVVMSKNISLMTNILLNDQKNKLSVTCKCK